MELVNQLVGTPLRRVTGRPSARSSIHVQRQLRAFTDGIPRFVLLLTFRSSRDAALRPSLEQLAHIGLLEIGGDTWLNSDATPPLEWLLGLLSQGHFRCASTEPKPACSTMYITHFPSPSRGHPWMPDFRVFWAIPQAN